MPLCYQCQYEVIRETGLDLANVTIIEGQVA
jgi:hypothetical protein